MTLFEFSEPDPVTMLDGQTALPLCTYFIEVILTQPYWRSSAEALEQAEEMLDQVEQVKCGASTRYGLSKDTLASVREQMKLAQVNLHPNLVRAAVRYGRVVANAKKPEPKKESEQ